jgi:hypothetical protein
MKIALCLYGQPRDFKSNWNRIKNNIIDNNNVDVFLHAWYDQSDRNIKKMTPGHENRTLDDDLIEIIPSWTNAKFFKIEEQKKFNDKYVETTDENIDECWSYSKNYDKNLFVKNRVMSSYSMWYSINQSLLYKELYSQENNFEYDCVILSRFDVSPNIKINFRDYNLTNIISGYKSLPRNEVNDWFLFSNNKNMNVISTLFYLIDFHRDNIIIENGIWTNEAFLRDQLNLFKINVEYKEELKISF